MTDRCDVLVIGGGLLGCALAWHLARDGADVVLLERDQINQHASGQNAGSLHFQLEYRMVEQGIESARRAAAAMPLHLDAARAWARLSDELDEDIGVSQEGGLMLAEDAAQARLLQAKAELERSHGLDVRLLSGPELHELAPYLAAHVVAASYCPLEGKADTRIAAPALARAAIRCGARVHTRARVSAIDRQGARWRIRCQPNAPAHAAGSRPVDELPVAARAYAAETVVLAAGAWTTAVGELLDAPLPTIPVALTMSATLRTARFLPHLVQHAGTRLSLKQSADGNLLIGGGWPARLARTASGAVRLDRPAELRHDSLAANAAAAVRVVPALAELPVLRAWTGITTLTTDQLPLLGPVPDRPGVFVATGGSGFTLGPTYARLLAELIHGTTPELDITPYDPRRFCGLPVA